VDLFFVLSGFLITGILVDSKGSPNYLVNFYMRRALRIFPLYLAVLTAGATGVALVPAVRHWMGTEPMWWQFVYATNLNITLHGWQAVGWFGHFWSLAIEEHYYLCWPFVVLLFRSRTLIGISMGVWVVVFIVRWIILGLYHPTPATYVLTPLRVDSLALGSCLAVLVRNERARAWLAGMAGRACWSGAVLMGALVVGARSVSHEDFWLQGFGFSLFGIFYAALLLQGLFPRGRGRLARLLMSAPLRAAGKYSYGWYVFHVPVFMLFFHSDTGEKMRRAVLPAGWIGGWMDAAAAGTAAVAVSLVVTLLSWNLLEKRMLRLKHRFE
jgi:peptidoglycan/LPS O-acetylase OafA/YrhL